MSYLVLARKYRPRTFAEVVGQKPVVQTLQNSIRRDRVAHAILFSGVRGVGKTTLARLMAKALNCERGPAPEPCNDCRSCGEIGAGAALDLIEIDGASNRGIQEVRELKEKVKYLPTSSRCKIVIIDEVHMLTNEAFNALLKTLEEPPAHVFFMFATTELHKIPVTILSRCQRFELKRVGAEDLSRHFSALAEAEGIELESGALKLIVREAGGSVRDGLSLLDQVFSYGDPPISVDDVTDVLGLVKREVIVAIAAALLDGNRQAALTMLTDAFTFGVDVKRFIADLLDCFRSLLLIRIGGCEQLLGLADEEEQVLRPLAEAHPPESLHRMLNHLLQTAEDLRLSLQPRLTIETAFLSIIESTRVVGVETLLARLDSVIEALPDNNPDGPDGDRAPSEAPAPEAPPPDDQPPAAPPPDGHGSGSTDERPTFSLRPAEQRPTSSTDESGAPVRDIRRDWLDFISFLKKEKEWMAQSLQLTTAVKERGRELVLEFGDATDCFVLRDPEHLQTLTEYILDFFQQDYVIRIKSPDGHGNDAKTGEEGPHKRRQQLAGHQLVRMTEEIFNGRVGDIRISDANK